MDDFFLPAAGQKRRAPARGGARAAKPAAARAGANGASSAPKSKRGGRTARAAKPAAAQKRRRAEDEEKRAESDDDVQDEVGADVLSSEASESEEEQQTDPHANETADEKRLRLAKELIEKLRKPENEEGSLDDEDVAERIRQQTREKAGLVLHKVADSVQGLIIAPNTIRVCKNQQRLPITSICIAEDERTLFSASKDSTIVQWDVETGKKVFIYKGKQKSPEGHNGAVLSIATSTDGKFLASGGDDKLIRIWDAASHQLVGKFTTHKDAVSGLAFRAQSHQLFSASFDRAVKVWNVDEMSEVETLFGHQAEITSLDCIAKERFVTSGRDGTARVWKVVEETQLTFEHKSRASLDCIAMLAEDNFVTGSQDGSISLWNISKKKALHVIEGAHSRPGQATGSWISSLAALRHSDLFASGASDGMLRCWQWDPVARQIRAAFTVAVEGVINSIAFARSGRFVAAGVGRDPRLGRWYSCEGDNSVRIVPLPLSLKARHPGDEAAGADKSA